MFIFDEPLVTERMILRAFRVADTDDIFAIRSDEAVTRYLMSRLASREEVGPLLAQRAGQNKLVNDDDVLVLAAERFSDGRMIGEMTIWLRSVEHRQGEIGWVFHPEVQGQGYAREAAERLLELGFGQLGMHRICAVTDLRNEPSWRLMERLGMTREAHLRQNEFFAGQWADELIYGLLQTEWQERKRAAPQ